MFLQQCCYLQGNVALHMVETTYRLSHNEKREEHTHADYVQTGTDLAVWWIAEELPFGVLHGARDRAVHQTGHS